MEFMDSPFIEMFFYSYQKIDVTKLMSYLSYKAERAGRRVVKVDPRNASKTLVRGRDCP
jgi:transposase